MSRFCTATLAALMLGIVAVPAAAQRTVPEAPARGEGDGPHERLIVRGVTIIDGTGAPPWGPADIVVEGNRITEIRGVGAPGNDNRVGHHLMIELPVDRFLVGDGGRGQ